jgi:4,5-DOPA dioxygenase extradiol
MTQPAIFVSHGAPTLPLDDVAARGFLTGLGARIDAAFGRPSAILVASAHWETATPEVSAPPANETIHDFRGFPAALYDLRYPAPPAPGVAAATSGLLRKAGIRATIDLERGLDHGAWVPLMHLFPDADVPVFQVSLPSRLDAGSAWAFGQALAPLAGEGVLVVGSGSLTHNLHEFRGAGRPAEPYVTAFAAWVRDAVERGDRARLLRTLDDAPQARRAHPTTEHFWPLLVAAGAADTGSGPRPATVIEGGVAYGMLAMDAYAFGLA